MLYFRPRDQALTIVGRSGRSSASYAGVRAGLEVAYSEVGATQFFRRVSVRTCDRRPVHHAPKEKFGIILRITLSR